MASNSDTLHASETPTIVPSASSPPKPLDLESELSCSICTEILYQPLTLLDCLHTFCGSCLKEWFSWQEKAVERQRRGGAPTATYTCPSCRAAVRDTRPNATVTTLLDMYLQANPRKVKSEGEREEIGTKYKPGDVVLPALAETNRGGRKHRPGHREEEDEDRRLLQEIREMSLREIQSDRNSQRAVNSETNGNRNARSRRREERSGNRQSSETSPHRAAREELERQLRQRQGLRPGQSLRSLEHQASLRTLMSSSRTNPAVSQAVQDDILRQINEEGLLDNVDLSNLDMHDEAMISEVIAAAYLSRRGRRPVSSGTSSHSRGASTDGTHISERAPREATARAPPVSRPHLLEAPRQARSHGRRSSSQGSSRSVNNPDPARSSGESLDTRANSQDIAERRMRRQRQSGDFRAASSDQPRAVVERRTRSDQTARSSSRGMQSPASDEFAPTIQSPAVAGPPENAVNATSLPTASHGTGYTSNPSQPPSHNPITVAPKLSCSSCSRPDIQNQMHYICPRCPKPAGNPNFTLCQRCYLSGVGCRHWYGFGRAAQARYSQQTSARGHAPNREPPHIMQAERWDDDSDPASGVSGGGHHQSGLFCASCQRNANGCYWRCDECNDGEWGFCNSCVNQARHCTHTLLPVALDTTIESLSGAGDPPSSPENQMITLPVHTTCNHCRNPIPPSHTRFHCPTCNEGDYDICNSCYRSLVASGAISHADGPHGWRKCEQGHRMVVVGFESRAEGQRRIVVAGIVGGWRMPHEETVGADARLPDAGFTWHDPASGAWRHKRTTSQSADPSGPGMPHPAGERGAGGAVPAPDGARVLALWTRLPDEGVDDELMFPKRAEITEVININENWSWGVYCRRGGMFPGAYCRAI